MEKILGIGINVTFSGIVIVFSMLVLLVLILVLFGKVGQLLKKEENMPKPKHTLVKVSETVAQTPQTKTSNEPSPEIIAVIAAAVAAMYSDTSVKPVIKSVRRAGVRPVWAAAGIAENTRPF